MGSRVRDGVCSIRLRGFAVINALKTAIAVVDTRHQRAYFCGAEVVFEIELAGVNLIEEPFLQTRILKHLTVNGCRSLLHRQFCESKDLQRQTAYRCPPT